MANEALKRNAMQLRISPV